MKLFEQISTIEGNEHLVRQRAYGVITFQAGEFTSIQFRPWPKIASVVESVWQSKWGRQRIIKDRCMVYYSQPMFHKNFLTLNYIVTNWQTTLATVSKTLSALDHVAKIKGSDAILCEVANPRITNRVLARFGFEEQQLSTRKRHWIKRFYDGYPDSFAYLNELETDR